jgi:hypothetical protein
MICGWGVKRSNVFDGWMASSLEEQLPRELLAGKETD